MWSWLSSLLGLDAPPARGVIWKPELAYDPTLGDRRLRGLKTQLKAGQWMEAKAYLSALKDPDALSATIEILSEGPGPVPIDAWVKAEPHSALPLLLRGRNRIYWAWEARGGGTANTVTDDGLRAFVQRLALAEDDLRAAASLDANDATAYGYLLIVGRGLSHSLEECQALFKEATARCPTHLRSHQTWLVRQCEKWGGSHDAMFALARDAHASAPEGSRLHALLAQAHAERFLFGCSFDEDPAFQTYYKRPEVVEELRAAYRACFASGRHTHKLLDTQLRNEFAFGFYLGGQDDLAKPLLLAIGDGFTQFPWGFLDQPVRAYTKARESLGL
jgi:hypothetical protein